MTTVTEKRLLKLETEIKAAYSGSLWLDMSDNTVTVGMGHKRRERVFPTVIEAVEWAEKQIDQHDNAFGGIVIYNICDLYPDSNALKNCIRSIIPGEIKRKNGVTFSADHLPGIIFAGLKTGQPADIKLWALASLIKQYFDYYFWQRVLKQEANEEDDRMFTALFLIFVWDKAGQGDRDTMLERFVRLIFQAAEPDPGVKKALAAMYE